MQAYSSSPIQGISITYVITIKQHPERQLVYTMNQTMAYFTNWIILINIFNEATNRYSKFSMTLQELWSINNTY